MAVALYRKYRPRTFAEVIGQEHVTEPLCQALRTGRLHHAYLFSGPRGCGKTTSARILARSLNCVAGPTPEPCGECDSCRALAGDGAGSVDVIEIDAASHGGVDDARDLRERAFFTPVSGRYKIYVIDEAHMVSPAGFNALLKLVEEPPEYVTFVFATTEPEKVLPTIKSRTHHYPFRLVPPGVLRPYLEQLCAAEGVAVEPAVFPLVVRAGGGSVRDSLSVLDQLIAGADADQGVTYPRAVALLGVTDAALLDEVVDALAAGDGAAMFATVDRVIEAGHDPRRFAADLLERLRDLIVLRQVPDAAEKGLLDAPEDALSRMATQAAQVGVATLTRCAEVVHTGLVEMRGTTSPRLLLELICARMLLPGVDDSAAAVWQRLERLERRLGAADAGGDPPSAAAAARDREQPPPPATPGAPEPSPEPSSTPDPPDTPAAPIGPAGPDGRSAPDVPATPDTAPAPPPPGKPAPAVLDAAAVRRVWDEVVTTVGRRSKRVAAVAREATVRDVDGDTVVLLFQHQVHATMLASAPQPVADALHEILGGGWQLRCETRSGPSGPVPAGGPAGELPEPADRAPAPAGDPPDAAGDWPEPARPGGTAGGSEAADAGAPGPADPVAGTAGRRAPRAAARRPPRDDAHAPRDDVRRAAAPGPGRPAASAPDDLAGSAPDDLAGSAPDDRLVDGPGGAARSGEQQALDLLRRTLGAETIGEVAPP